jgi:hypothetical protein
MVAGRSRPAPAAGGEDATLLLVQNAHYDLRDARRSRMVAGRHQSQRTGIGEFRYAALTSGRAKASAAIWAEFAGLANYAGPAGVQADQIFRC